MFVLFSVVSGLAGCENATNTSYSTHYNSAMYVEL